MTDHIFTKLNNEFDPKLHQRIMREIIIVKYKNVIYGLVLLLSLNFAYSFFLLWEKLSDLEFLNYMRLVMVDFEIDQAIIMATIESVYDIMPAAQSLFAVFSFIACVVVFRLSYGHIKQLKYFNKLI